MWVKGFDRQNSGVYSREHKTKGKEGGGRVALVIKMSVLPKNHYVS